MYFTPLLLGIIRCCL